jgi:hypothetical protein
VAAITGKTIVVEEPNVVCASAVPEPTIEQTTAAPIHFQYPLLKASANRDLSILDSLIFD